MVRRLATMHSRRNRLPSRTPAPAPLSEGSSSKSKRKSSRSLARTHQAWEYILTFLVICIILAYMYAMTYVTDGGKTGGGSGGTVIRGSKPKRRHPKTVIDWRVGGEGGPTPEGQKRFAEQQKHVEKDLKELVPKLQDLKDMYEVVERGEQTKYTLFKPFNKENKVQLDVKRDKHGKVVYTPITSVKKEDLPSMGFDKKEIDALGNITYDEAINGRERLVDILHEAGVDEVDPEAIAVLPKWSDVQELYGDKPVVLGLERCEEFRREADPLDISVGIAGMFNTGTNPMAMYVSNNCKMPTNRKDKAGGTRWQVPWGKHRLATEKWTNVPPREGKTNKTNVLPVVLVRDPYTWMQSMCKHQYETRWPHQYAVNCPNLANPVLQDDGTAKRVPLLLKNKPPKHFDSLADYWGQWYKEYLEADYPRLIVRFEDIHYHAREVVETICQCAGAVPREKDGLFRYVTDAAKWGSAHTTSKNNMISAMLKYGNEKNRFLGFKDTDWKVAGEVFTPEIMDLFGYKMPEQLKDSAQ